MLAYNYHNGLYFWRRLYFWRPLYSVFHRLWFQTEEDLLQEKLKIKKVSDELDQTFDDMLSLSV